MVYIVYCKNCDDDRILHIDSVFQFELGAKEWCERLTKINLQHGVGVYYDYEEKPLR